MSTPKCLDSNYQRHTLDLVDDLDMRVKAMFEMIDSFAKEHGCHENLDFQTKLFELEMDTAETAFKIGMLAGAHLCRMLQGTSRPVRTRHGVFPNV
jgi:hypothetical protein